MGGSIFPGFLVMTVVFAMRHYWLIPFVIGASCFYLLVHRIERAKWVFAIGLGLITAGWSIARSLRPGKWWYLLQGNDSQFFESIIWSTSKWGIFEHPGFAGGNLANYHWFSYAFLGGLTQISGLGPWVALMNLGAPLVLVCIASLFLTKDKSHLLSENPANFALAILLTQAIPTARFDSLVFSILVAMVIVQVSSSSYKISSRLSLIAVLILLSFTLILSKASTALVVLVVITMRGILQIWRKRNTDFLTPIVLLGSFLVLYFGAFRTNSALSVIYDWRPDLPASLTELRNFLDTGTNVQLLLLLVFAVFRRYKEEPDNWTSLHIALLVVAPLLLTYSIIQVTPISGYFGYPAFYLTTFIALSLGSASKSNKLNRTSVSFLLGAVVLIGFFGFHYQAFIDRLNREFDLRTLLGDFFMEVLSGSGLVLGIFGLWWITYALGRNHRKLLILLLPGLLFASSTGFNFRTSLNNFAYGAGNYETSDKNSASFPTDDLRKLGHWVRVSTAENTLLASNNFCCAGLGWFYDELSQISSLRSRVFEEDKWGGANYLLPAETRRRFLVQGLRFQAPFTSPTQEQLNRLELSLIFANQPSKTTLHQLVSYGVEGFIVNLNLTDNRSWLPFAVERFRSGSFIYLDLTATDS